MKRVRAGSVYTFQPVMMDIVWSRHHSATAGERVRVINLPGAPKANTMGQCHIENAETGDFLGMVSVHSLTRE
jgi:hypothetical protein